MLINKKMLETTGSLVIMSDINLLAASAKSTLLEIAKQAAALGIGLQNAAPSDRAETPNSSVQYLLKISEACALIAKECEQIFQTTSDKS